MKWLLGTVALGTFAAAAPRGSRTTKSMSQVAHTRHVTRHVVSARHRVTTHRAKAGVQWMSLAENLWATLVLHGEPEEITFEESDAKTKKYFLEECPNVFDVPEDAVPDDVIEDMCAKASGTDSECSKMVEDFWTAYDDKDLKPWCQATYVWFHDKTLPKCLGKCRAMLCKERCDYHSKLKDLQDRETSVKFKQGQAKEQKESLAKRKEEHEAGEKELDEFEEENCKPLLDEIEDLEKVHGEIGESWGEANQTFTDLLPKETASHDELAGLYEEEAPREEIEAARKEMIKVLDGMSDARDDMDSLTKRMKTLEGIMAAKQVKYDFQMERLGEKKAAYKKETEELQADLEENKKRIEALEKLLKETREGMVGIKDALSEQLKEEED